MMPPMSEPSPPQTIWASGAYTTSDHTAIKAATAPKRMRPATEPVTMAQVMSAKAIWNVMSTSEGYTAPSPALSESIPATTPERPNWVESADDGVGPIAAIGDRPAGDHPREPHDADDRENS